MRSFLILIALYSATRLFNILILPIFTDESSYLYTSVLMKENILAMWDLPLALPVVKPPLFFFLTTLSETLTKNALFTGRLVSVFSGAFTLTGLYVLTNKLFEKKTAILASILYILSPFALTYDRLALMDSLLSAFSVWILYFALTYLEVKKIRYLLLLISLCFLSLLAKQSAKFFLLMLPFVPVIARGKKEIKSFFILVIITLITYLIYLLIISRSKNFEFYNIFDKTYINFSLQIFINNFKAVLSWIKSYFPLIFVVIPFSVIYLLKKNFSYGLLLSFWGFMPVIISMVVGNYFFPRYLLPSIIFLFPMIAFMFKKHIALLILLLIPSLIFDYYILTNPPLAPYHYNERAQFISEWPSGYGVKEAYDQLSSVIGNKRVYVEGDNGQLISSFKLMGGNFDLTAFKQNLDESEVINNISKQQFDYLLINRRGVISSQYLKKIWSYQRPYNGDNLILYEVKHN